MKRVLVDGRVFSTAAFDRGMGRYVMHLLELLRSEGHDITVLLYRDCQLPPDHPVVTGHTLRFANYSPEDMLDAASLAQRIHEFTAYLSALIDAGPYDAYVDATPFLGPLRLDLFGCAVVAICYDFIPLKHPDFYLTARIGRQVYYNGLARLVKADHIICISETVRDEAARYLAIRTEQLSVVTPKLEPVYSASMPPPPQADGGYLFAILGSHKSKNPGGSLHVYEQLLRLGLFDIRVNSPKHDQKDILQKHMRIPEDISVTSSITDEEKFAMQSGSRLIAHLSLEEGFGIPLLEGIFLGRKIIALDTAINQEFFRRASSRQEGAVFLLDPHSPIVDERAFVRFLNAPPQVTFYQEIRDAYERHWKASPSLMTSALSSAITHYEIWAENLQAKIFSSIPGNACGVADYSVAYVRSAPGNVMLFFSEGDQEYVTPLRNTRAGSHLDFERFSRSRFSQVQGLFNFAFSPALHPGIELMRKTAKRGDVVLIHERRYFDGLHSMQSATGRMNEFLLDYTAAEAAADRTRLARHLAFHPTINKHHPRSARQSPIASNWLRSLPVRAVSHLPPAVLDQMRRQAELEPGSVVNDLEAMEPEFHFVPLGIDDRRTPNLIRAAQRLRVLRQVQQDDIVIGHCGLILNDLKRLWDVVCGFLTYAKRQREEGRDNRRLFFFLVGKVIDEDLFGRIRASFAEAGLANRLVHSNPAQEADFDAEITACDAIACFRIQTRGQLSHVFVRALALGTPVLVNERSGYSYDPRTTIDDTRVSDDLAVAIDRLFDRTELTNLRQRARQEYERTHRGDASLRAILQTEAK